MSFSSSSSSLELPVDLQEALSKASISIQANVTAYALERKNVGLNSHELRKSIVIYRSQLIQETINSILPEAFNANKIIFNLASSFLRSQQKFLRRKDPTVVTRSNLSATIRRLNREYEMFSSACARKRQEELAIYYMYLERNCHWHYWWCVKRHQRDGIYLPYNRTPEIPRKIIDIIESYFENPITEAIKPLIEFYPFDIRMVDIISSYCYDREFGARSHGERYYNQPVYAYQLRQLSKLPEGFPIKKLTFYR